MWMGFTAGVEALQGTHATTVQLPWEPLSPKSGETIPGTLPSIPGRMLPATKVVFLLMRPSAGSLRGM